MVGLTDRLDMTIAVDWDVKSQTKKKKKIKTMQPAFYPRFSAFHFKLMERLKTKLFFLFLKSYICCIF